MPPPKPRLSHLFLGGLVDRDGAFDVLEALLLSGSRNLIVDLPHVSEAPAHSGVTPGLSHSEPLALPAPKQKGHARGKKDKREDTRLIIARAMLAHDNKISPAEIREPLTDAGYSASSAYALIKVMVDKKLAKKRGDGVYGLTKKGIAYERASGSTKPEKKPRIAKAVAKKMAARPATKKVAPATTKWTGKPPSGLSQEAFVLKMITDNHPHPTMIADLKSAFRAHRMRPESVSVSLTTLKQSRTITSSEQGVYALAAEPQPTNQASEESHGSATA